MELEIQEHLSAAGMDLMDNLRAVPDKRLLPHLEKTDTVPQPIHPGKGLIQIPADVDFDLMARYTGFRQMGTPEEIASLFALIASDEGASFHGAVISCDNGITAG